MAMPTSRLLFGVLPWYSVLIVTGICLALFLAMREEKRLRLPKDTVLDLALWVIPFGVIGARLYYVAFAWDTFASDPISILYVWQGGLAIYGGIIGGLLAILLFSRKRHLAFPTLTDIIVPGLALAQAIGRWGNYFNMEAYGALITDPAWQFFPAAVLIPSPAGEHWHMATFFYESMWNLGVFAALMLTRKRMTRPGDATLWYVLLYGAGRLIIEGLRTDSLCAAGGIRISQLLSVMMCLSVIAVFLARSIKNQRKSPLVFAAFLLVLSMRLPRPAEAFPGYEIAWCVLIFLVFACSITRFQLRQLPSLLALLGGLALRVHLALQAVTGLEASTLLCIAFALTAITGGIAAYRPTKD